MADVGADAVSGLAVVGRNRYGVFPLRGKVANPRDANHEQIMKNEEIKNLKTIRESTGALCLHATYLLYALLMHVQYLCQSVLGQSVLCKMRVANVGHTVCAHTCTYSHIIVHSVFERMRM